MARKVNEFRRLLLVLFRNLVMFCVNVRLFVQTLCSLLSQFFILRDDFCGNVFEREIETAVFMLPTCMVHCPSKFPPFTGILKLREWKGTQYSKCVCEFACLCVFGVNFCKSKYGSSFLSSYLSRDGIFFFAFC